MSRKRRRLTPRQRQRRNRTLLKTFLMICLFLFAARLVRDRLLNPSAGQASRDGETQSDDYPEDEGNYNAAYEALRPELTVDLLDINSYSRPGSKLQEVKGIVVHYTANPGSSAKANRDYFNNLQYSKTTKASSHFVVGLEGEIVQCIPCGEIAYASNNRNSDTISIECCIEDDSGKFNPKTYDAVVELVGWLALRYDLSSEDVIRHYDVTGKICPKYFVDHPEEWELFKENVDTWMKDHR